MISKKADIPNDYWKAIIDCDTAYDDHFLYAVKTTGIFCRPSCKSRVPKKENVKIFKNAMMALEEDFRPCKRCKPEGLILPTEDWIEQITEWIDKHFSEPLTLNKLADISHGSPYHLQRLFKRVKGISPTEYIQRLRLEKATRLLESSEQPVAEIGLAVGFSSTPYFITLFKKKMGETPMGYRKDYIQNVRKESEQDEC
ncbi:Bifunctional transcriptional activator/DNA repair enzyme AdaA [Peribacillus sp. Bi96]|uniref:bifunctional transcriptional activator/DNA repair enzyme AdaA n=1 Tax=Peribacillus sp. Bi96 TaxID=2884273 RepID=UPI001D3BAACD|nr:bifunctional transcriptional activator/DNA repair enzyme AdaA [Peribacillus sp. Bi96]CAH0293286.1 Bifunctional transcriptional activator/DNA repair enzyme AdaA [Peribacillus sp. Bi96]